MEEVGKCDKTCSGVNSLVGKRVRKLWLHKCAVVTTTITIITTTTTATTTQNIVNNQGTVPQYLTL